MHSDQLMGNFHTDVAKMSYSFAPDYPWTSKIICAIVTLLYSSLIFKTKLML